MNHLTRSTINNIFLFSTLTCQDDFKLKFIVNGEFYLIYMPCFGLEPQQLPYFLTAANFRGPVYNI